MINLQNINAPFSEMLILNKRISPSLSQMMTVQRVSRISTTPSNTKKLYKKQKRLKNSDQQSIKLMESSMKPEIDYLQYNQFKKTYKIIKQQYKQLIMV